MMRFDMRAPPDGPASTAELYRAALDMAEWGERHGCLSIVVSEHHASPDGYLPSPLLLASAMVGRTRTLPIQVAALVVPLHDPIRLAEDMAVLDVISGGRVSYVLALGYRPEEYAMFGRSMKTRGRRMETGLLALRQAWTGEPFEFEGRPVRVTPKPASPGGPPLLMGGNSPPAARRAARFGLGFLAEASDPSLREVYLEECARVGNEPGLCIIPAPGTVTCAFVAEDTDRAWRELGPHLLHDATMYGAWMTHASAARSSARTVEELRAEEGPYRIFTPDEAVEHARAQGVLLIQPLCGGLAPERAWRCLELLASEVLPRIRST